MCVLLASKCVATLWGGVEFVTWLGVSVNSAAPSSLKKLRPLLVSSSSPCFAPQLTDFSLLSLQFGQFPLLAWQGLLHALSAPQLVTLYSNLAAVASSAVTFSPRLRFRS